MVTPETRTSTASKLLSVIVCAEHSGNHEIVALADRGAFPRSRLTFLPFRKYSDKVVVRIDSAVGSSQNGARYGCTETNCSVFIDKCQVANRG
jgi:hypothetical protein